jgi:hypothetical protein
MDAGRERSAIQSRFGEPFGDVGIEIMHYADELVSSLSGEPASLDESGAMPTADCTALANWLTLEHLVPLVDVPVELEGDVRQRAHDALSALHTALPFSEAERGWLVRLYRHRSPTGEDLPAMIKTCNSEVMDSGIKREIVGRDLMRRWIAWRREDAEYTDQHSVSEARNALEVVRTVMS